MVDQCIYTVDHPLWFTVLIIDIDIIRYGLG